MLVHDNTLISLDLLEEEFVCNIAACKGACCIEGESGAPLEKEELDIIARNLDHIKPYMAPAALALLERKGFFEKDSDGDLVTHCLNERECIFAIQENGAWKCAMEKAYEEGKTDYKKPISCHLYPVRASKVGKYQALNYSRWDICSPACTLGKELKVPVYKFLKEALVRKFGQEWYNGLEEIAGEYKGAGSQG